MKRYKSGIFSAILPTVMLALALALGSCAKQEVPEGGEFGDGKATVTLELVPPGAFSEVQTRALTNAQQNAINRSTVLVFKDDKVVQQVANITVEGNKMTINGIKTSQSESDKYDIVVLGNPPTYFSNYLGKSKDEIRAAINPSVIDKWTGTEFMMWGEATGILVHPVTNSFQIRMVRSLARIDIGLGAYNEATPDAPWSGLSNFIFTEVQVLNTSNKFAVIPDPVNVDPNGTVTAPSIPSDATATITSKYLGADVVNGSYCQSTIFVPETSSPLIKPVKLIIKGRYNGGASTYYRIDMCLPEAGSPGKYVDMNILRNHLYLISITSVLGPGYATVEEATSAPALNNIAVELNPINEGGWGDVIFDAHSSITTDVSSVQIYGKPDGVKKYTIATVKANFMSRVKATITGPGIGTLNLANGALRTISAAIPANTTTEIYTIKVGQLTKTISIKVQAPVDAHFDFLPFQNVASITVKDPRPWLTLSQNTTYKKGEQQSTYVTGNTQGKAVIHLDENISTTDAPRTAEAFVLRNNNLGTTRVVLEQLNLSGMVVGQFGGAKDNQGYTSQLAVESLEELQQRIYDDTSLGSPIVGPYIGMYWGFNNIATDITNAELGRDGTITLAERGDSGINPPYSIYENYVARYCYDKNRDIDGNGAIDDKEVLWYLPARNQLIGVWIAYNGISNPFSTINYYYWSATEYSKLSSWYVGFDNGATSFSTKNDKTYKVRCVRDLP